MAPAYPNPNFELLAIKSRKSCGFARRSGKAGHGWELAEETQLLGRKLQGASLSGAQSSVFPFRDPGLNAMLNPSHQEPQACFLKGEIIAETLG